MDVPHVEFASVAFGISVRVEVLDTAISGHLVLVLDDRLGPPSMRWIGTTLTQVITGFGQMPKVIDHAGANERATDGVKSYSPGIAGSFAKDLELLGAWMNSKHRAGELESPSVLFNDRWIKYTVKTIQISIWAPGQCIGQFVRIDSAKSCDHHRRHVGNIVSIGILQK